jgi:hypothetical protein
MIDQPFTPEKFLKNKTKKEGLGWQKILHAGQNSGRKI